VVAEEIKSLAEETQEATDEIAEHLALVHDHAEDTAEKLEETADRVEGGIETVEGALESLDEIASAAKDTNHGVQEIQDATAEQAEATQETSQMADELHELAQQTTSETERVVEAIEAQEREFAGISHEVKTLAAQATVLTEQLDDHDYRDVDGVQTLDSETRTRRSAADGTPVVIGSKLVTSNKILAYLSYELLEAKTDLEPIDAVGYGVTSDVYDGIRQAEVDLYWEYTGAIVGQILGEERSFSDPERFYEVAKRGIENQAELTLGNRASFNNSYCIVAPRSWCDEHDVHSLDDLAGYANEVDGALDPIVGPDFRVRDDGWKGLLETYPFESDVRDTVWERTQTIESAGERYEAINRPSVDVTMGFTVDALIDIHGLEELADERQFFPIYNPAPLVRNDVEREYPEVREVLDRIGPTFDDVTTMRRLVRQVEVGKRHPRVVAREFLEQTGLIE
jgi:osmoprotectant transport system substrate-binding protein